MSESWWSGFNVFAEVWAGAIGRACWQGALGLGLVWVACVAFPRMPAPLQSWLWRLAFLKLLVTLVWATPIPLPLLPLPSAPSMETSAATAPTAVGTAEADGGGRSDAPVGHPALAAWLLLAWLAGVVAGVAWVVQQWRACRPLRLRLASADDETLQAVYAELCQQFRIRRRPRLMVAGELSSPILMGLLKPMVVLPSSLLKDCPPAQVRLMMAHELAHCRRRDLVWGWLVTLVRALFFFHPLVWLAQREFHLAQEMASDEAVLKLGQVGPADYGQMVLRVLSDCRRPRRRALLTVGIVESYETLKRRLNAMKHIHSGSTKWLRVAGIALAAGGTLGLMPWQLKARNAPPSGTKLSAETPKVIPGTATITVRARGADGTQPKGARCHIETWSQTQPLPRLPAGGDQPVRPTVTGADGDWIIYNVGPGRWGISVDADGYAWTQETNRKRLEVEEAERLRAAVINEVVRDPNWKRVMVNGDEKVTLAFTLLRGGNVSGRVIAADTGQPIAGATVASPPWDRCRDTTDTRGRFTLKHVAPGNAVVLLANPAVVVAKADGYVAGAGYPPPVEEGQTVAIPDITLYRGGWISGRVARPPEAITGSVQVHLQGELPPGCMIYSASVERDGTFRAGPLPPGSYDLEAYLSTGKSSLQRWRGEVKGTAVEVGRETKDVVIEVSPDTRSKGAR